MRQLFSLVALSGDSAQKAQLDDSWIKLHSKGEISYFCCITDSSIPLQDIKDSFHFIRVDWNTGETGE